MSDKPRKQRDWGLPLLAKELVEQSSRRRTYIIRVVYACLLFGFATLIFWSTVYSEIRSPFEMLGRGRQIFLSIIFLQLAGIYLFMPAITCGVITSEKERNTIGLLLLTKLRPWTILFEKYLGRLIPMGTFLLLSLPLLGFSYAMGGISQFELWTGVWTLFITVLQVGALALACSAFFRTTVQAFIATYIIGFLMYFGPLFIEEMRLDGEWFEFGAEISQELADMGSRLVLAAYDKLTPATVDWSAYQPVQFREEEFAAMFFAPVHLLERWGLRPYHVPIVSLPTLASTVFFLGLARVFIVRRAFAPARNILLGWFKRLDRVFHRINDNRVTKGVVLIKDGESLPDNDPVAWRETKKKSLGTLRYLFRIFVATEIPVLILCVLLVVGETGRDNGNEAISVILMIAWILVTLLISVKSATLISSERSHETLDVLLSTPISGSELLRQKFKGVRRLMLVLSIPLLTTIAFQAICREAVHPIFSDFSIGENHPLLYLVGSLLAVLIYLPMVAWISFYIGLRIKSQARAIFASLAVIVGWCAIPLIIVASIAEAFRWYSADPWNYFLLLSPATVIPLTEFNELGEINHTPWFATFLNFAIYGSIYLGVRQWCLWRAARHFGRAETVRLRTVSRAA